MDFFRFTVPSRPQAEIPVPELIFLTQMSMSIVRYCHKTVNLYQDLKQQISLGIMKNRNFCKSSSPTQVSCTIINNILTSVRKITCDANFGFSQKFDFVKAD